MLIRSWGPEVVFHAKKLSMLIRSWGPEVVFHAKICFILIRSWGPEVVFHALKNTRQLIFARKTSKTEKTFPQFSEQKHLA